MKSAERFDSFLLSGGLLGKECGQGRPRGAGVCECVFSKREQL